MQTHLDREQTINLGSFYTPRYIVEIAYKMLQKRINLKDFLLFDSSCGYGDFFIDSDVYGYLGADIDSIALQSVDKNISTLCVNSLENVSRKKFGIKENEKLIIIGNPPYNDKTSIIRNGIKQEIFAIDSDLKHRDIGISFLRSYALLEPEFVCVLHPLSYLVKKANFTALKQFKDNYCLVDSMLVSSANFSRAKTHFPIILALYERDCKGMDYEFIQSYSFTTSEGKKLRLKDFDFITKYVHKYPNPHDTREAVAYFHTLRDINALKRNKTFVNKPNNNTIRIFSENLKYYYYIHHFKSFAHRLPYYFGNLDVFIDNARFLESAKDFMSLDSNPRIEAYFTELFRGYV